MCAGESDLAPNVRPGPAGGALRAARPFERWQGYVGMAVALGVTCAIVGAAVGLRMALHATVVGCPDGTYFPQGVTDFRCFAHHHAGEGAAIVLICVMLAIVMSLCGVIATAILVERSDQTIL